MSNRSRVVFIFPRKTMNRYLASKFIFFHVNFERNLLMVNYKDQVSLGELEQCRALSQFWVVIKWSLYPTVGLKGTYKKLNVKWSLVDQRHELTQKDKIVSVMMSVKCPLNCLRYLKSRLSSWNMMFLSSHNSSVPPKWIFTNKVYLKNKHETVS